MFRVVPAHFELVAVRAAARRVRHADTTPRDVSFVETPLLDRLVSAFRNDEEYAAR